MEIRVGRFPAANVDRDKIDGYVRAYHVLFPNEVIIVGSGDNACVVDFEDSPLTQNMKDKARDIVTAKQLKDASRTHAPKAVDTVKTIITA